MPPRFEAWCDAVAGSGYTLPPARAQRLAAYVDGLVEAARAPNLTGLRTAARIDEVLVRPSLLVAFAVDQVPRRVADVGSGNGFPGIVAAAIWPEARTCLIERRGKKARAVGALAQAAGFDVEVLACDAREVRREGPAWYGSCDLVTVRAVGPLDETTKVAAPLLAPGGRLVHWKTDDLDAAERDAGCAMAATVGLRPLPDVQQRAVADARLIVFERSVR